MKKNIFKLSALAMLSVVMFTACKKSETLPVEEKYQLIGRIDASRTTIATAALTSAKFTISYNNANSFGNAQSVLAGSLQLTGYTGITGKDTCAFFATQASGPAISYITAASAATNINSATNNNFFNYFNGPAAVFNATNYPFSNEITASLKEGKGYFRLGQYPKYVFVLLDNVTKL
jgi:hypothetical protein